MLIETAPEFTAPTFTVEKVDRLLDVDRKLAELERRGRARNTLQSFAEYIMGDDYIPYHHSRIIAQALTKFGKQSPRFTKLILTVAPQHGKSLASSELLPAWLLGRRPNARVLVVSYGVELASGFCRAVQRIMDSEQYQDLFPESILSQEHVRRMSTKPRRTTEMFDIPNHRGGMEASGVGGDITGKGYDYIIIDDLIKNQIKAESPTERENAWGFYHTTIRSRRRSSHTPILLLNTRWNQDDISGRLLKLAKENPVAEQWNLINLPELLMDCEDPEGERWKFPPGQELGREVLWPERFPYDDVMQTRAGGAYAFSCLYMGNPTAREGNVFKRRWFETSVLDDPPFQHFFDPNCTTEYVVYWDIAYSDSPGADRTVGTVMARYYLKGDPNPRSIILHQIAGQWNPLRRDDEIVAYSKEWDERIPGIRIMLENQFGPGKDVSPAIRDRLIGMGMNAGLDDPKDSKYARADRFISACEAKRVELYCGAELGQSIDWIYEFLDEATRLQRKETAKGFEFTGGHDDRIDSPVGGWNYLHGVPDWDDFTVVLRA